MKKVILGLLVICGMLTSVYAYTIGGAYARLISCKWGKYGYEYGNIGIYDVNGERYKIFFGSNSCEY